MPWTHADWWPPRPAVTPAASDFRPKRRRKYWQRRTILFRGRHAQEGPHPVINPKMLVHACSWPAIPPARPATRKSRVAAAEGVIRAVAAVRAAALAAVVVERAVRAAARVAVAAAQVAPARAAAGRVAAPFPVPTILLTRLRAPSFRKFRPLPLPTSRFSPPSPRVPAVSPFSIPTTFSVVSSASVTSKPNFIFSATLLRILPWAVATP